MSFAKQLRKQREILNKSRALHWYLFAFSSIIYISCFASLLHYPFSSLLSPPSLSSSSCFKIYCFSLIKYYFLQFNPSSFFSSFNRPSKHSIYCFDVSHHLSPCLLPFLTKHINIILLFSTTMTDSNVNSCRLTAIGHFIKMGRFDKTLEGFRKDSVSHGKTCADI
jgi:hypothetical protein